MNGRSTWYLRNSTPSSRRLPLSLAMLVFLALAAALALPQRTPAQPYDTFLGLTGYSSSGFVRIPHSASLNPTGAFTVEAWVAIRATWFCNSIAGKNLEQAWWIGICGTTLRSYLKGSDSQRNGGTIPRDVWTHIAVTFDGANRRHYINGELVGTFPETGPLGTSGSEVRIGSDVAHDFAPAGFIDEVRIWNVARSEAQLRAAINVPITAAEPGLVSVWSFQGNAADIIGANEGAAVGGGVGYFGFGVGSCVYNPAIALCLWDRFTVSTKFRTGPPGAAEGTAQTVAVANEGSGLFWFFSDKNWEVLVKLVDGCGLNNRHWVFSAATTNVFYKLTVFDLDARAQKIYFNYPGPPAPAVTDTGAFSTCP